MNKKNYVIGAILMILGLLTLIYRVEIMYYFIGGKDMALSLFSNESEMKVKLYKYGIFIESLIIIAIGVGLQIQEVFKLDKTIKN
jgi:dipeptide/tripeptide permease